MSLTFADLRARGLEIAAKYWVDLEAAYVDTMTTLEQRLSRDPR
jgi:hypothetical protein